MALPTDSAAKISKTEGTTQTYGQLITIPEKKDIGTNAAAGSGQNYAVSPKDTLVKIVPNNKDSLGLGSSVDLTDTDRSKISISAFSDTKEPTVALSVDTSEENISLEGSRLNSFSRVAQNQVTHALVAGSALKSREEIKKVLTDARKVDMMITLKSKDSEEIEFNNLKEIDPESEFTYNFFIQEEEDIISQEDQAQDPLLKKDIFNVPRYVELQWKPIGVTEKLTREESGDREAEIRELKRNVFTKSRGVAGFTSTNFRNSFEKSKKKMNAVNKEGVDMEVADMHKLDVAIDSTSNKNRFANSVNAVFNVDDQEDVVNSLPVFLRPK